MTHDRDLTGVEKYFAVDDIIVSKTNLLALKATTETALAGDAGKGFADVATEVTGLTGQTSHATDEISGQVSDTQMPPINPPIRFT